MNKLTVIFISLIMILSMCADIASQTNFTGNSNAPPDTHAQTISTSNTYSAEPAPMGIVDYGIGSNGQGISLNSTSFTGIVNITDLQSYNASITSCPDTIGIQLNLVLSYLDANTTYYYWVQNVAFINTSSKEVSFLDNVWNFTSDGAEMHNSTLNGNGNVSSTNTSTYYYFCANNGKSSHFNYKNLELRSLSYMNDGTPHVYMEYNDGSGWVTYDTLNFAFATDTSHDYGFIVNGSTYLPNYLYADAGLILGGPGNGTKTTVTHANLTMELEYWNGDNYQAVTDAYNHGSDTAEGVCNVSVSYDSNSGSPMARIETGNTNLGELYNSGDLSIFNFTHYLKSGYITLNGVRYNYTGPSINLTLNPGIYNFTLYSRAGQDVYTHKYDLKAGEYGSYDTHPSYNTTFTEYGLPHGTKWYVKINGNTLYSTGNNITFILYNGTYNYTIPAITGYTPSNETGNFTLNGNSNSLNVTFSADRPAVISNNQVQIEKIIISIVIVAFVALLAIYAIKIDKAKK